MASLPSSFNDDVVRRWGSESSGASDYQKFSRSSRSSEASQDQNIENTANSSELAKMVETEIIPRLMLAHSAPTSLSGASPERPTLNEETTESFAQMVISNDPECLIDYICILLDGGLAIETIYMDLLIPAARRLGAYWDDDVASFTDVTIGLGRLQQVVRALGCRGMDRQDRNAVDDEPTVRSALFAAGPVEQHTFGLFIVEDVFRRAGWRTWMEIEATDQDVIDTVRLHWFDIVVMSMSVSSMTQVEKVTAAIKSVRSASRNSDLFVLVGGRLFTESPELVAIVGADATASNGADAFQLADKAVRRFTLNQ